METNTKILNRYALLLSVVLALWPGLGCDKTSEAQGPSTEKTTPSVAGEQGDSCRERAVGVVKQLQRYQTTRPSYQVEFELPLAKGEPSVSGTILQVGPEYIEVDGERFELPEETDVGDVADTAGLPKILTREVRDRLRTAAERQIREAELRDSPHEPRLMLAVHPDVRASTVDGLVSHLGETHRLNILARDPDAEDPPERTRIEWLEPRLAALEAEDDPKAAVAKMKTLEQRIMGDCDSQLLRTEIGQRIGVSALTRQVQLSAEPLPDRIAKCGCDNVDLEAFQAAMEWALRPQQAPPVALESSFERAFSENDVTWSEVVARHRK